MYCRNFNVDRVCQTATRLTHNESHVTCFDGYDCIWQTVTYVSTHAHKYTHIIMIDCHERICTFIRIFRCTSPASISLYNKLSTKTKINFNWLTLLKLPFFSDVSCIHLKNSVLIYLFYINTSHLIMWEESSEVYYNEIPSLY